MQLNIDRNEILRYLGYRNAPADARTLETIEAVLAELLRVMLPRSVTRAVPITIIDAQTVQISDISITSSSLQSHLKGCSEGVLLAATLGAPVDLLIQRYNVVDISKAVICQACAAAVIEAYCDEAQAAIAEEAAAKGCYLRPRYSPGYGDFPLTYQKELLELLNAQRRINLSRTESNMLVPTKSVTAVIGFSTDPTACHTAKCMTCSAINCPFRKE